MKKLLLIISIVALGATATTNAQLKIGGKTLDNKKMISAANDAGTAVTLSDADVAELSKEAVDWMDAHNPVLPVTDKKYGERLARLTKGITSANGIPLNFKVYHVIDINAFACGDGSVRVFSSLMDILDDNELMAIIGHEIGHVANTDAKDAMKSAYLASAARKAVGSTGGKAGKYANSDFGAITESFLGASFSKSQENAADEYGFNFLIEHNLDPYGMANALQKFVNLSNGSQSSAISKMFSSHPDSEKRAAKMRAKADAYTKNK